MTASIRNIRVGDIHSHIRKETSEERENNLRKDFFNLDFFSRQGEITTTEYVERASQILSKLEKMPTDNKSQFRGDLNKVLSNIENRLVKSFEALGWIKNHPSVTPEKTYKLEQAQASLNEKIAGIFFQYNVLFSDNRKPHLESTPPPPKKEYTWLHYANPITYLPTTWKVYNAAFNFAHRELELSKRTTYAIMGALSSHALYSCNLMNTATFVTTEACFALLLLSQF